MQESFLSPKLCLKFPLQRKTPLVCFQLFIAVTAFVALPTFPSEKGIISRHEKDALSGAHL